MFLHLQALGRSILRIVEVRDCSDVQACFHVSRVDLQFHGLRDGSCRILRGRRVLGDS